MHGRSRLISWASSSTLVEFVCVPNPFIQLDTLDWGRGGGCTGGWTRGRREAGRQGGREGGW